MKIIESFLTKNLCYKKDERIKPTKIMLHSTACKGVPAQNFVKAWNTETPNGQKVCVHAFVNPNEVYQTLPWTVRAWHCGGLGNNVAIGFEICEPKDYADKEYFAKVKQTALELCVYLIKQFDITVDNVTSHCEGYRNYGKAFASNHSDLDHWWKKYHNYTMDDFRIELNQMLKEENHMADVPEISLKEKEEKIKEFYNLDDNTIKFFEFYRYNVALIDKLYSRAKNK